MTTGCRRGCSALRRAAWGEGSFVFQLLFDYEGRLRMTDAAGERAWRPSAEDLAARDWELC